MNAAVELSQMAQEIGRDRLANPTDDLSSALMHAEVEGDDGVVHRLTAEEYGSFFILLVAAGNETTRNAISHGMYALTTHPDQRALLAEDFEGRIPDAVEEIVRWATPVIHFRRTATEDCVVGGQEIAAGDKVVHVVQLGQPGRGRVRRPLPLRHRPHAQRARRLRRRRAPLLPRRQPGPARDHGDVPRALPPRCPTSRSRASPTTSSRASSTASSACRARSRPADRSAMVGSPYEPVGLRAVRPYLIVGDAEAAIEFYRLAFDALEIERHMTPTGGVGHVKLQVGESIIEMGEHPDARDRGAEGLPRVGLRLYVADVDQTYERALAAGATGEAPSDRLPGTRAATVSDPFGLTWWLAARVE